MFQAGKPVARRDTTAESALRKAGMVGAGAGTSCKRGSPLMDGAGPVNRKWRWPGFGRGTTVCGRSSNSGKGQIFVFRWWNFPGGSDGKESACNARKRLGFDP